MPPIRHCLAVVVLMARFIARPVQIWCMSAACWAAAKPVKPNSRKGIACLPSTSFTRSDLFGAAAQMVNLSSWLRVTAARWRSRPRRVFPVLLSPALARGSTDIRLSWLRKLRSPPCDQRYRDSLIFKRSCSAASPTTTLPSTNDCFMTRRHDRSARILKAKPLNSRRRAVLAVAAGLAASACTITTVPPHAHPPYLRRRLAASIAPLRP